MNMIFLFFIIKVSLQRTDFLFLRKLSGFYKFGTSSRGLLVGYSAEKQLFFGSSKFAEGLAKAFLLQFFFEWWKEKYWVI